VLDCEPVGGRFAVDGLAEVFVGLRSVVEAGFPAAVAHAGDAGGVDAEVGAGVGRGDLRAVAEGVGL
jgi:hypothetical protein